LLTIWGIIGTCSGTPAVATTLFEADVGEVVADGLGEGLGSGAGGLGFADSGGQDIAGGAG
jgi:hypothetical protein